MEIQLLKGFLGLINAAGDYVKTTGPSKCKPIQAQNKIKKKTTSIRMIIMPHD